MKVTNQNGICKWKQSHFLWSQGQESAKTFSKRELSGLNSINKPLDKRQNHYYYLANLYSK